MKSRIANPITKFTVLGGRPYDLDNYDTLKMQYAKILNYFRDDLAEDLERDRRLIVAGQDTPSGMLRVMGMGGGFDTAYFPHKKVDSQPWSLENLVLRTWHSPALGAAYEGYLSCNGAIVTIRQAARFLCIEEKELIQLKLWLILDERVIAEAIKRMLRPRPEWLSPKSARA